MGSLVELAHVLERIRLIKGISNSETSIHLETIKAPLRKESRTPKPA